MSDPLAAALRLVDLADRRGLLVRLTGGLAFQARSPGWTAPIDRPGRDIDFVTRHEDRRALIELLAGEGYVADRAYNAIHGQKQLYFEESATRRPLDLLIDRLEMAHTLELRDRLRVDTPTLPLADLLLTKLQIVAINRKDVLDMLVLLRHYPIGGTDEGTINARRIATVTSHDWGWWRTVTANLVRLREFASAELNPNEIRTSSPQEFDLGAQIDRLHEAIDRAPKSMAWQLRARVGDRVRWYEEPEEVGHPG